MDFREVSYRDKIECGYGLKSPDKVRWGDVLFSAAFGLVVFFLLAGWPVAVLSEEKIRVFSATNENGKLTLTSEPCTQHPWLKDWKLARWIYQRQYFDACWTVQRTEDNERRIVVLDSGGDVSVHSPSVFKLEEGI